MKKTVKVLLSFTLVAALLALSACGGQPKSKVDQIKKAKKLVVYTNPEFPPYEFAEGNEIVGVDIEIAKAVADKLGVSLEVVSAEFGGIIASIASGKGDVGISGFTITEERKESVDFSIPYVDSIQYIIVPQDSSLQYMEELAGKKCGAQLGTTGYDFMDSEIVEGVLAGTDTELFSYNAAPSAMQDLVSGRIDAVVIDELVAIAIAKENPGYKAVPFKYTSGEAVTEQFGVAIAKGNEDLLKIIDDTIAELLSSGMIDAFFKMYEE